MMRINDGNRDPATGIRVVLLIILIAAGAVVRAQHEEHRPAPKVERLPDPGSRLPADLGWEPIRCWRQSSAGAVAVGEMFTVVLTCAVYEGDNAQVRPDESRLGVASIQLAPFEIVGGSHPPDVRRGTRRFFQYDYQLRIISPDAIGHDVNIPPLTISYRIQSRVGAAATLDGRDLSYLMPMMPIKVLSLVPADASDIRDASEASLAAVDSLRFRSSLFQVLTITFGALAAVMLVLALVPLARTRTTGTAAGSDRLPDRAVLTSAMASLDHVQSKAAATGWNDELVADALATMRLVAAAAINQPISQKPLKKGEAAPEGRLHVDHGLLRPAVAAVSSAVTSDDVKRARGAAPTSFSTTRQQQLEGLEAGLVALTAALYRKEPSRDAAALNEAVVYAHGVAKEIAAERSFLNTYRHQAIWARR